jgi:predicted RNase H-like nuclease
MVLVAGVDGAREGWIVALKEGTSVGLERVTNGDEALRLTEAAAIVALGLPRLPVAAAAPAIGSCAGCWTPEEALTCSPRPADRPCAPAGRPLRPKARPEGLRQRIGLLARAGFGHVRELVRKRPELRAKADDILDACAAAWTAERILHGKARRLPPRPPVDGRGLRMEIWF